MNLLALSQNIFQALGLENISEDKKKELLVKMDSVIGDRITYRIMDELSEADKQQLDGLMSAGATEEARDKFLSSKVNLQLIVMEEVANFKEKLAEDLKILKESLQ